MMFRHLAVCSEVCYEDLSTKLSIAKTAAESTLLHVGDIPCQPLHTNVISRNPLLHFRMANFHGDVFSRAFQHRFVHLYQKVTQ